MLLMNKFHKSTTPALLGSSRPSWVLPCSGQRASIAWGQTHLIFTFVAKVSCFTPILLIGPGKGENPGIIRWALDGVGEFGTCWAVSGGGRVLKLKRWNQWRLCDPCNLVVDISTMQTYLGGFGRLFGRRWRRAQGCNSSYIEEWGNAAWHKSEEPKTCSP